MYNLFWLIMVMAFGGCEPRTSGPEVWNFDSLRQYNPDPITVTGTASIVQSGALPIDFNHQVITNLANPRDQIIDLPEVFLRYSAQDRLMTKRTATADAYSKLAQAIYDLKVSKTQTLRECLGGDEANRIEMMLRGQTDAHPRYLEDGTIEIDVSLALDDAVRLLKHNIN